MRLRPQTLAGTHHTAPFVSDLALGHMERDLAKVCADLPALTPQFHPHTLGISSPCLPPPPPPTPVLGTTAQGNHLQGPWKQEANLGSQSVEYLKRVLSTSVEWPEKGDVGFRWGHSSGLWTSFHVGTDMAAEGWA